MKRLTVTIVLVMISILVRSKVAENIETPIDTLLKNRLEALHVKDQTLRLLLPEVEKQFGIESPEEQFIWSIIHQQDSICLVEVCNIIEKYGWLGKSKVGDKANMTQWLIIQHADLEIQEKYLPLIKKSVKIGETDGWQLAYLEDRILMRKDLPQIYGTQTQYNKNTGKYHIATIKDPANVNKRRTEVGLSTIEKYAKKNGYILNF